MALANEGVHVTLTARGAEALNKTADEIRKANPGVTVTEIIGDITTPAGREAVLKACPDPDILVNNASGPPPGDFRNWTRDDWIKAVDANMLTPIELIKATVERRHEGRKNWPYRQHHLLCRKGRSRCWACPTAPATG